MSSDIEYVEQFLSDYRVGYKEFTKTESQDDRAIIDELLFAMEKYDLAKEAHERAQSRPVLTLDVANLQVPKKLSGRKHMDRIRELLLKDQLERSGTYRSISALVLKMWLDKVRSHGLIRDSENVSRRFRDCTEQSVKLQEELHQARQRISDLENLARLHGIDPSPAPKTLGGDVEEGGG